MRNALGTRARGADKPSEKPLGGVSAPAPHSAATCPIGGLLEALARPWTLQILWVLSTNGPTRFGALRRSVEGISSRVLAERLRALEEKAFIYREYKPTIPPEVTYGITKRMKDIERVLAEMGKLSVKWNEEDSSKQGGSGKIESKNNGSERVG
jgi:DNA-binding HxlR family transcriptional regulator